MGTTVSHAAVAAGKVGGAYEVIGVEHLRVRVDDRGGRTGADARRANPVVRVKRADGVVVHWLG